MYRAWGGDIINMSVLPEAKLAREAEIRSAILSLQNMHMLTCIQLCTRCHSYRLRCLEGGLVSLAGAS
jgi:hypothetical protein